MVDCNLLMPPLHYIVVKLTRLWANLTDRSISSCFTCHVISCSWISNCLCLIEVKLKTHNYMWENVCPSDRRTARQMYCRTDVLPNIRTARQMYYQTYVLSVECTVSQLDGRTVRLTLLCSLWPEIDHRVSIRFVHSECEGRPTRFFLSELRQLEIEFENDSFRV